MADRTNAEVSDERLREIIDGCEGVTPGPWVYSGEIEQDDWGQYYRRIEQAEGDGVTILADHTINDVEARHLARLDPATVKALATELLNRRSVTSQASEGEVVAWTGQKELAYLAANPMSTVVVWGAQRGEESSIALYASPVSKRVERLETINECVKAVETERDQHRIIDDYSEGKRSAFNRAIIALQALQGGRS